MTFSSIKSIALFTIAAIMLSSCYTLNGISISEETQTYYVEQFEVSAIEAPNANNQADLNRLTIRVSVEYTDSMTEKNSYTNTFTDFEVFNQDENLLEIQDRLLEAIFERIAEEAFNKAFSNW